MKEAIRVSFFCVMRTRVVVGPVMEDVAFFKKDPEFP
jgi:hypothetical protein